VLKKVFKAIMAEDFPNLAKGINLQIQEDEQTPHKINPKKHTLRHSTAIFNTQDKETKMGWWSSSSSIVPAYQA
jgi:hypothetical protein